MMVEFYCKVRVIKNTIVESIQKIDTSDKIINLVLDICNNIEVNVLNKIFEEDDEALILIFIFQLKRFDALIKSLEIMEEKDVLFLLRCYVGDMLHLINDGMPEMLDQYRRNSNKVQERILMTSVLNEILGMGEITTKEGMNELLDNLEK